METVRKIYTVGEALVDIIFRNNKEINRVAGGSVVNSSVTLGRLGLNVNLVSEMGADKKGAFLLKFLNDNHVNTGFVKKYGEGKTAFSNAYLNEKNEATYRFFNEPPEKRKLKSNIDFEPGDILLFCSRFAIDPAIHKQVIRLVALAKRQGCLVLYDPNFRKVHLEELEQLKPAILENISLAGLVRGSDEDFLNIFGARNSAEAYVHIKNICRVLIYTSRQEGVVIHTPHHIFRFPVQYIQPVSTIGAGDTFNAGLIYALIKNRVFSEDLPELSEARWEKIVTPAIQFSAEVCKSLENFIPPDYAEIILK